ncbi:MAG TPA: hypothetical protein VKE93_10575 [Candidatus Angelobacter sp.]|nr:hypothetical protein [Candidatus Angelobacter sp.]
MTKAKTGISAWKISRWCFLAVLLVVLALLLKKPASVAPPMTATEVKEKAGEFQAQLSELETSHDRGEPAEARFNADQVNAAFQQSAAEQAAPPAPTTGAATPAPVAAQTPEPVPEVRTVQIAFAGDHLTGQFASNVYGKDVYLTVTGKIGVKDGYATFEFTEAKIDSLPVPVSLLNPRLQEKLQEPENREKLKLPNYVADLRVENGQLVIVEK